MAGVMGNAEVFTASTILDAVKVGCDWYRRREGLTVSEEDRTRIVLDLIERFEGDFMGDTTRRGLVDAMTAEFQKLLDAKHMVALGAVPMLGDKLQPIEDEL